MFISHKYLQLPLIPEDEFLRKYPEHAQANENGFMVARINHEHAEREALEQERQGLLKKKQILIAENKKRKDDLASIDTQLEKFIDVCAILRDKLHAMGILTPAQAAKPIQKLFEKEY